MTKPKLFKKVYMNINTFFSLLNDFLFLLISFNLRTFSDIWHQFSSRTEYIYPFCEHFPNCIVILKFEDILSRLVIFLIHTVVCGHPTCEKYSYQFALFKDMVQD